MPIDDLNKELYNYNSKIVPKHKHEGSVYDPGQTGATAPSPFDEQENWNKPQKGLTTKQKKIAIIGGSIFFAIVLAVAGFFVFRWWQKSAFYQDRVSVYFEGPQEVDSTQDTKYIIHYKNDNRATLKNAEIRLNYSGNFQPTDNVNLKYLSPSSSKIFIGDIAPKSKKTVELVGRFYAPKDFPVYLYASLDFVPSNSSESVSVTNQIGVNITAAPVLLDVIAPQETIDGYDIEYLIDYKNLDIRRMSDMQIRVEFPQGFRISKAQPMPSEKNSYWYIGNMEANQGGKIIINGQLQGVSGDQKSIFVSLGQMDNDGNFVVFDRKEYGTKMVSPVLTINQSLNNKDKDSYVIKPGENLSYEINYKNTGAIGLRDAIIYVQIEGKILDFSKLSIEKGSYDEKTGIITWKASDVPELKNIEPQAAGSVKFSIPVKSRIPADSSSDRNFIVSSVAKIDSPDIPVANGTNKIIGSNKLELKLASKVIFEVNGYYNDSKISNSGPLPLKVGSPTTFTIHWLITNISNDVSNTKIISSLPSGLRWTGKIYPENEKITYSDRTNQIIWDIGDVAAGVGVLAPKRDAAFQIEVIPQSNQVGEPIALINESILSATDTFTGEDIMLRANKKDTQLNEDPSVGYTNGKVEGQK